MPESKTLPVFTVQVTCSRQWGDPQQNSLDPLIVWSAHLSPELGLKITDAIAAILNETLPGAMRPISEAGARALDALGKNEQLNLIPETPKTSNTEESQAQPACALAPVIHESLSAFEALHVLDSRFAFFEQTRDM